MATARLPLSPHYLEYARLLRELHELVLRGEGETDRADEIRDAMDGPWGSCLPRKRTSPASSPPT
jgi:hypothetical protein